MVLKFVIWQSLFNVEPLQVVSIQSNKFDKVNISHGNRNKASILLDSNNSKTFPQKAGAEINKKEKPFFFISVRRLFTQKLQYIVVKNCQRNIFQYLQIDWFFFFFAAIKRWDRRPVFNVSPRCYQWKHLVNQHNLSVCQLYLLF